MNDEMYTDEYWRDLIQVIIDRIGEDKFMQLASNVLATNTKIQMNAIGREEKWKGIK